MALGADPELALAVRANARKAGMGLDIALVRRRGLEAARDDHVGFLKALLHVAVAELVAEGDVRIAGAIVEVDASTGRATGIRRLMLDEKALAELAPLTP